MYLAFCLLLLPAIAWGHGGGLDEFGGHTNKKANVYHCHKEPCLSTRKQVEQATKQAPSQSYSKLYNRKDWPHWIDSDNDCQNTRHELLLSTSQKTVTFKDQRRCTVRTGLWLDPYTGVTFTQASDLDIDHIVPLAHAHRNGAAQWTRNQRKAFANDPENLLVVDDSTNQAKSDKGPDQWMPPSKDYWCEYKVQWMALKKKYELTSSSAELAYLSSLICE